MQMRCTGGRYPGLFLASSYDKTRIACSLRVNNGVVLFRIDDALHPVRWEEFAVDAAELAAWLAEQGIALVAPTVAPSVAPTVAQSVG